MIVSQVGCVLTHSVPVRHEGRYARGFRKRDSPAFKKEPLERDILSFYGHYRVIDQSSEWLQLLFHHTEGSKDEINSQWRTHWQELLRNRTGVIGLSHTYTVPSSEILGV